MSKDGLLTPTDCIQLLNCVRLLSRLLPFIFEAAAGTTTSSTSSDLEQRLFWTEETRITVGLQRVRILLHQLIYDIHGDT
jgi:hypothetical protein